MAWVNPTLRTTGDIVAVSVWNTDVIENLSFLGSQHDHDGDAGDGATASLSVPSGLIAIFDTTCPTGWTRVSAFDNNLLKGSPNYGATGGASTHTHGMDWDDWTSASQEWGMLGGTSYPLFIGYDYPSGSKVLQVFPFGSSGGWPVKCLAQYGTTGPNDPTSSASGLGGTSEPYPPYIDVVFCKKD